MLFEETRKIEFVAKLKMIRDLPDRHIGGGKIFRRFRRENAVEEPFRGESGIVNEFLDESFPVHTHHFRHLLHIDARMTVMQEIVKKRRIIRIGR